MQPDGAAGDLYVSGGDGSDGNGGRSAESPLRTLARAAQLVRAGDMVHVAAGEYVLDATLELQGAGVANTTWIAESGRVSVSGGARISPGAWEQVPTTAASGVLPLLRADVSSLHLDPSTRHLFVNGRRAPRARMPASDLSKLFATSSVTDYGYDLTKLPDTPCAADFGSHVPCCGQPGGDVGHQYECPANQPVCTNYVYNQHWGECKPNAATANPASTTRTLPSGSLILAYAVSCDDGGVSVLAEARAGVNVIVWFATNLLVGGDGTPSIGYGLNTTCIASVAKTLRDEGLETAHLISIGGWDAPHPNTTVPGEEWWRTWKSWNQDVIAMPDMGWAGFDGIDWDLEGNDAPASPDNHFTQACLDLVGTLSAAAKSDGFLVTLVPPESYMDASTSNYDRFLRHRYPEDWHTDFLYHGQNAYAYLLAAYPMATWDLVDIQLYESYAHADYFITQRGMPPEDYLTAWIKNVTEGWMVHFEQDPSSGLKNQVVAVPPEKLVIGFSFGLPVGSGKTVFIWPEDVGKAYARFAQPPRGVMFWNLGLDRASVFNGTKRDNYTLAGGFNAFLRVREKHSAKNTAGASAPLPPGAELVFSQSTSPWTEPRCAVESSTPTAITMKQPCWFNLVHKACGQNANGPPTYIEGVAATAASTAPGHWSLSADTNYVYYRPLPDESLATTATTTTKTTTTIDAVVPKLEVLVRIGKGADGTSFSGFTFEHATWLRPGQHDGYVEQQTGACTIGNFSQNNNCNVDYYWSVKTPGNVQVVDAEGVTFKHCEFTRLGATAVDFTRAPRARVAGCLIHDVSGSGVQIGQFQDPLAAHLDVGAVVSDTIVNKAGAEYSGAAGINVGYTQNLTLMHNDVSNLTYVPITVGWGWSRHECYNCTNAGSNMIAWNRVHDYKQMLNDGGGIYMLGPQNHSLILENYVFDQGTPSSGALYPDEGSAYSTWRRNVVAGIGASEWLHLWNPSIHNVTVEGNFADTPTYENHGTNCPMVGNTVYAPGKAPAEAVAIMHASGVRGKGRNPWYIPTKIIPTEK
jgi:hypothetical protein